MAKLLVEITEEQKAKLKALAKEENTSMKQIIGELIDNAVLITFSAPKDEENE